MFSGTNKKQYFNMSYAENIPSMRCDNAELPVKRAGTIDNVPYAVHTVKTQIGLCICEV